MPAPMFPHMMETQILQRRVHVVVHVQFHIRLLVQRVTDGSALRAPNTSSEEQAANTLRQNPPPPNSLPLLQRTIPQFGDQLVTLVLFQNLQTSQQEVNCVALWPCTSVRITLEVLMQSPLLSRQQSYLRSLHKRALTQLINLVPQRAQDTSVRPRASVRVHPQALHKSLHPGKHLHDRVDEARAPEVSKATQRSRRDIPPARREICAGNTVDTLRRIHR